MHGITYVGNNMPARAWGRQPTFYVALTGLEENIGDIIPRALPWAGLFCPYRSKVDSCEDRHGQNKLRAWPALPGFASCRAFVGVTDGGQGGRWIPEGPDTD